MRLLLNNGKSLFAYHLPLDLHQAFGNNWKAARDLGWTELQSFEKFGNMLIGVKREFSAMSRDGFANI